MFQVCLNIRVLCEGRVQFNVVVFLFHRFCAFIKCLDDFSQALGHIVIMSCSDLKVLVHSTFHGKCRPFGCKHFSLLSQISLICNQYPIYIIFTFLVEQFVKRLQVLAIFVDVTSNISNVNCTICFPEETCCKRSLLVGLTPELHRNLLACCGHGYSFPQKISLVVFILQFHLLANKISYEAFLASFLISKNQYVEGLCIVCCCSWPT